ncbi:MAG: hypothetical protein Q7K42_00540, partial [Candidatus Diapherotrites archaeon]|nr:hypothetical protein [Candidatus Diapherotrites archaeon]
MEFDFFKLHNSEEDKDLRECLRLYSVVPKFAKQTTEKEILAERIVKILQSVNEKLKKENLDWKRKWIKTFSYSIAKRTVDDWFLGRASIPLFALQELKKFGCEKEVQEIMKNSEYFCSTTGKVFKLPPKLNPDLAWLVGAILCDGHMHKLRHGVSFEVVDKILIIKFQNIFNAQFGVNVAYKNSKLREKRKQLYRFRVRCKPVVRFFEQFFEIPRGKKSHKIVVPQLILNSNIGIKKAFLIGVFDTDGGKRRNGLGLTSA